MIKGAINRSAVGTVGVDDLDRLPFVQTSRAAAPCRYNLKICRHIAIPLPLAHWRICPVGIIVVGQRAKGQATSRSSQSFKQPPATICGIHFCRPSPSGADDAAGPGGAPHAVCAADVASQPTDQ